MKDELVCHAIAIRMNTIQSTTPSPSLTLPTHVGTHRGIHPLVVAEVARLVSNSEPGTRTLDWNRASSHRLLRFLRRALALAMILGVLAGWPAAAAVPSLDSWQWRSPLPQGNDLHGLIHADGRFVAVGDYGSILQSMDGANWTVHNQEIDVALRRIAFGNGIFVAVGDEPPPPGPPYVAPGPVALSSPDGMNWNTTRLSELARAYVTGVAFGNGTFVMVGWAYNPYSSTEPRTERPTFILTSTDGESWTDRSLLATNYLSDVTFGNGLFVAVGSPIGGTSRGMFLTSPDGVNWTSREAGTSKTPQSVTYGNGRFVAVSESSPVVYWISVDGLNWTSDELALPGFFYNHTVSAGSGKFLLTMRGYSYLGNSIPNTTMLVSPDGLIWNNRDIGAASNRFLNVLVEANGVYAAVGEHGNLASSLNGVNWTDRSAATDNNLRGVAYGNGRFVAVGNNGTNLTSPDGVNWTGHDAGTTRNLREVIWAGDAFLAVGSHGTILRSFDGAAWMPAASITTEDLWDVTSGGGTFVAVGGDSVENSDGYRFYRFAILSSSDGQNWTTRLANPNYNSLSLELHGVAYGGGRFVAVGRPHAILTSVDGITWATNQTAPWFYYLKDIVYGNGLFVAVGESTNALVSPDGLTWTERPLPVPLSTEMDDVTYSDGTFLAVGDEGVIVSSGNGLDWTRRHSPTDTSLRGLAFGADGAVIVGNNDLILHAGTNQPPRCDPLANWFGNTSGTNLALNDVVFGAGRFVAVGANGSIATSTNGLVWTNQSTVGLPPLLGVAYGNSRFVAVGAQGLALMSTNGLAWNNVGPGRLWSGITFGAGKFVAVTTNGLVLVTTDGINFGQIFSPQLISPNGITHGNDRFVAVGQNGAVMASTNGTNWTTGHAGVPAHLADVTYANGFFVAVGAGGTVVTSIDGLSWVQRDSNSAADLTGVTYGYGRFVAVANTPADSDGLTTSTDGITWIPYALPKTALWNDIAFGNGSFVVVGQGGSILLSGAFLTILSQPQSRVVCAEDSVAFTVTMAASCPVAYQWRFNGTNLPGATKATLIIASAFLEDAGMYSVAVSDDQNSAITAPATLQVNLCRALDHWTQRGPPPGTNTLRAIACGGGQLVAVGSSGAVLRSVDGLFWSVSAPFTNTTLNDVAYGGGQFVAVGLNGTIATSTDGVNWSLRDSGTNRTLRGVIWGAGLFAAVGDLGYVTTSSDGVSWVPRNSGANRPLLGIVWAGNQFIAVGASGTLLTSPDGFVWTPRSSGTLLTLHAVAGADGIIVSAGNAGIILRSTNGVDWVQQTSPTTVLLNDVTFAHGQFVIVGAGGAVLTSPDGMIWAPRNSGTALELTGVTSCGDSFYAVGANGLILRSGFAAAPFLSGHMGGAGFELGVTAEIGAPLRLQATPSLVPADWVTMQSMTNTRPFTTLLDVTATNSLQRFFRAVSP